MLDINALSLLVGFVLVLVVAFLVGREVVAWYFKINEAVTLLREIRDRLPASTTQRPVQPASPLPMSGRAQRELADMNR